MSAINSECHGETRRAYKATVRMATDPCYYFARNIYKSMKGLGTDDDALVRNIIFTSEVYTVSPYEILNIYSSGVYKQSRNDTKRILVHLLPTTLKVTAAEIIKTFYSPLSSKLFILVK